MKIKSGFTLHEVCGVNIIVGDGMENIDFNKVCTLSETAAHVWRNILGKEVTIDDMADIILAEYEVDRATAVADCRELARQLVEAGVAEE